LWLDKLKPVGWFEFQREHQRFMYQR